MKKLKEKGFIEPLKKLNKKKYFLGICVGMQILMSKYRKWSCKGLGLIKGK